MGDFGEEFEPMPRDPFSPVVHQMEPDNISDSRSGRCGNSSGRGAAHKSSMRDHRGWGRSTTPVELFWFSLCRGEESKGSCPISQHNRFVQYWINPKKKATFMDGLQRGPIHSPNFYTASNENQLYCINGDNIAHRSKMSRSSSNGRFTGIRGILLSLDRCKYHLYELPGALACPEYLCKVSIILVTSNARGYLQQEDRYCRRHVHPAALQPPARFSPKGQIIKMGVHSMEVRR
ncbi:hypothetical protein BD779DRAFT_1061194 [Infundibulicybe gibba]|nr:hypothetical protein BD779DRAFT_1061194 [Infundibulicybe gibba]